MTAVELKEKTDHRRKIVHVNAHFSTPWAAQRTQSILELCYELFSDILERNDT